MQPKEKTIHHDIPKRPLDIISTDMFQLITEIIYALLITIASSQ